MTKRENYNHLSAMGALIACGAKAFETRSWATSYRGPIAIHAGKKPYCHYNYSYTFYNAVNKSGVGILPYGVIIATAELVECYKITDIGHTLGSTKAARIENIMWGGKVNIIEGKEILFGDWEVGRYAWEFANVMLLPEPVPVRGRQRLWEWEMEKGKIING